MKAIILDAGIGRKIWPYNTYHNKGMIKIGNKPILMHLTESLEKLNCDDITIVAKHHVNEVQRAFRQDHHVRVVEVNDSLGTAHTLKQVIDDENCLVLYGDCLILEEDLRAFLRSQNDVLVSQLHEDSTLHICCEVDEGCVHHFWGHPRGDFHFFACAFKFNAQMIPYLTTSSIFNVTKVGIGSPEEMYLESALNDYMDDYHPLKAHFSVYQVYDIDKPWHIMEANKYYNQYIAKKIKGRHIGNCTCISQHMRLPENIIIGDDCYIGDYVVIGEGCVIEDHTRIDNGALIGNGVHIGKKCVIEDHCKIGDYSSIGDECIMAHTAEVIEAVLFDKVYLYHYGEYYGVIGTHTDLGAGTTCGTLRFDDGKTSHHVCGHREIPTEYSNACFIGDYSRTGVGAILLPGCKVGSKSVVGSGVILNVDLEDLTLVYPKQELCKKKWDDDNYGW